MTAAKRPRAGEGARAGGGAPGLELALRAGTCPAGWQGGGAAAGDLCGGEVARPETGFWRTRSYLPSCLPEFHFVDTQHVRAPNRAEPVHMTPRWAHVQRVRSQTPSGGHRLRPVAPSPGWVHAGSARGGSMLSSPARRLFSQLCRFASRSGDDSAVPCPPSPPLRPAPAERLLPASSPPGCRLVAPFGPFSLIPGA